VKDQIAANHPRRSSWSMTDARGRHPHTRSAARRDAVDPSLGEFRKDFAGLVGQLYEFPQAHSARNPAPGSSGATEARGVLPRIATDPAERVDNARLPEGPPVRRHDRDWTGIAISGAGPVSPKAAVVPIPDDRDSLLALRRSRPRPVPPALAYLQTYSRHYPSMKGLTWNGWEQDRQLLAGWERPVWEEWRVS